MTDRIVIVGGGLAAATAATELRRRGFAGSIRLLAAEPHAPYIRPPLSKGYLQGSEERSAAFVHPDDWYGEHEVELSTSARVESIDRASAEVTLADGEAVPYDRLLLATGAEPRRLSIPGADARGIHSLRTLENSEELRDALAAGSKRVALVGAGWIGLEVAAAARSYGNDVVVIGREKIPLKGPLGDELGLVFQRLHESHGVRFELGTGASAFRVDDGRVTGVQLIGHGDGGGDPRTVDADLVVVGAGAIPSTELATAAGLTVDNGIQVDASLRTSDERIFAAGDVANAWHPVLKAYLRNEHWATAKASGKVAAASLMGEQAQLDAIPYFYTDQFELGMEYSGYGPLAANARVVFRGDPASLEFIAFWIADGRVVAGMNVNVWDVNDRVQDLIRSGRQVDLDRLTDLSIELAEV
ncbi:MAG TPA: FAD-dependent oxidoreductase [Pseudolysinimonas sp.]|nr:FAD-dependent oxidoreductase [Pseudolysinimonas sp.]